MNDVLLAFLMTLIAGGATTIGSLMALGAKKDNKVFFAISLGFSTGVMIYVSMIEIFPKAQQVLMETLSYKNASIVTVISFFGWMILIGIIDKLIIKSKNPHEFNDEDSSDGNFMRMGIFTALAIAIHDFPEGIAVDMPIYQATGSKKKAFFYSLASGLTEPIGPLIGWLILMPFMNNFVFGIIFATVAGIMFFISLDELLPCARKYGKHHHSKLGLVIGMLVMTISLLLFI